MKHVLFILFYFSFLSFSYAVDLCKSNESLRVGFEEYPPFQFKENGKLKGIDVDLLRKIGKETGCKIIFVEEPWARQLNRLSKGEIDIVLNTSLNKERQSYLLLLSPYIKNKSVMMMKRNEIPNFSIDEILDIKKLNRFMLGITSGYTYGSKFEDAMNDPRFVSRTVLSVSEEHTIQKLIRGEVTAILGNPLVIGHYLNKNNLPENYGIYLGVSLGNDEEEFGYLGYGKRSLSKQKALQIDTIVKYYVKNGEMEKIITQYIDKETARAIVPTLPE